MNIHQIMAECNCSREKMCLIAGCCFAELRAERYYLLRMIEEAGSWGAAVGAMQERVDGINRTLNKADSSCIGEEK